jgi:hypothetical protein
MKKFTFFLVLMFAASFIFGQAQTFKYPNARVTVTNDQIKAWGEASQQNGSRSVTVLDFEGLGDLDEILQFYNGGLSLNGFGPGANYGIYFGGTTLSIIDADNGGSGNFANEPSPNTVMFFLTGGAAVMNVPAGFTTGFSFFYTSSAPGTVYVYDGLDGTGSLLATQPFAALPLGTIGGDPNGYFDNWQPVGVGFTGTAKSVTFVGVENQCGFDDVTFGSITPGPSGVPISNWALFIGIGLILIAAVIRFRRII